MISTNMQQKVQFDIPLYPELWFTNLSLFTTNVLPPPARATATGSGSIWFDRGIAPAGAAVPRISGWFGLWR